MRKDLSALSIIIIILVLILLFVIATKIVFKNMNDPPDPLADSQEEGEAAVLSPDEPESQKPFGQRPWWEEECRPAPIVQGQS